MNTGQEIILVRLTARMNNDYEGTAELGGRRLMVGNFESFGVPTFGERDEGSADLELCVS